MVRTSGDQAVSYLNSLYRCYRCGYTASPEEGDKCTKLEETTEVTIHRCPSCGEISLLSVVTAFDLLNDLLSPAWDDEEQELHPEEFNDDPTEADDYYYTDEDISDMY